MTYQGVVGVCGVFTDDLSVQKFDFGDLLLAVVQCSHTFRAFSICRICFMGLICDSFKPNVQHKLIEGN